MRLTRSEVVEVTPVMAERWIEKHFHSEWQRKLVGPHVEHLRRLMREGIWTTGTITFGKVDGQAFCANGGHTLHAIAGHDQPVRCLVEWWQVKDMAEYVKLFHCFDTESRKRTALESAQAFLMGTEELPEISPFHLDMFRKGVDFLYRLRGDRQVKATQFEKFENVTVLKDELDMYVWLAGQEASRELLHRAPVIAAIVATYQVNSERCKMFWKQVVTGFFDCQHPDDPCVKLNRFLRDNAILKGNKAGTSLGKISTDEMYCACVRAWNAFVAGRKLSKLQAKMRSGTDIPQPLAA